MAEEEAVNLRTDYESWIKLHKSAATSTSNKGTIFIYIYITIHFQKSKRRKNNYVEHKMLEVLQEAFSHMCNKNVSTSVSTTVFPKRMRILHSNSNSTYNELSFLHKFQ